MAPVKKTEDVLQLWNFDQELITPYALYAGVDEAGRGALAGPVVAAAVILGGVSTDWHGIADSKVLSKTQRERLCAHIYANALAVGVGAAGPSEIDEMNILHASRLAMARALYALPIAPEVALVDGPYAPLFPVQSLPCIPIVDGDAKSLSVAAASIVAKVERDQIMADLHTVYPGYGFLQNAGYPTARHLGALEELGPTDIHRYSYRPVQLCSQARLDV